jgi:DNA invertase Pin-like site-specific DNA recombinase
MNSWREAAMDDYVIAKYIRLSIDDARSDSMSIENQRAMLDKYIACMDIPGIAATEFVDNGYTGTNFERPAVQELIGLVREGCINCVIVKDFSRFGRNVTEAGYFLERVFPLYRVRFISLTDAFDSDEYIGDTGGMEVSLKLLLNECYSRDLSRKIKSSKREKMRRGELVSKNCPYGYVLDKDRKMVIDQGLADAVRKIFDMYAGGCGLTEIAERLYRERKVAPYARKKYADVQGKPDGDDCVWSTPAISGMLHDERYIGTYVAGKTAAADIGVQAKRDPDDWVRIPDHHPAIIERHIFESASRRFAKGKPQKRKRKPSASKRYGTSKDSPLKGKVYCACCGHPMHLSKTKNAAFSCGFSRPAADMPCHGLRIAKEELEAKVFEIVRGRAGALLQSFEDIVMGIALVESGTENKTADCLNKEQVLYEKFVAGEISREEYMSRKFGAGAELNRLKKTGLTVGTADASNGSNRDLRKTAKTVADAASFTGEISNLLVDRVLVYPDRRIEVRWKAAGFAETVTEGGPRNAG